MGRSIVILPGKANRVTVSKVRVQIPGRVAFNTADGGALRTRRGWKILGGGAISVQRIDLKINAQV